MAIIAKLMHNVQLQAHIKIKSDQSGGTVTITKQQLTRKPGKNCQFDPAGFKFQDVTQKCEIDIINMQWSGWTGTNGTLTRGGDDLQHTVAYFTVGDTDQLQLQGQIMSSDREYSKQDISFTTTGPMTIWLRVRKRGFNSYSGQYASYGGFEDDSRRGPYQKYEKSL